MNKNVPRLRFKEFSDEWKEKVLGELIVERVEKTEDKIEYPLYSLTIEAGVVPKSDRYEREFLVKKEGNFKIVNNNDFVYNPMNLRFGALATYRGEFPVSVSGYYNIFYFKNKGLEKFWDNYLKTNRMMYIYNTIATGSLEEKKRVHYSQFKELKLPIPALQEQERIANFFTVLDNLIEEQEAKVNDLELYKKGMMQQIFKQKIRFKDENGQDYPAWEEKKFGEIMKEPQKNKVENPSKIELITVKLHCKGIQLTGKYPNDTKNGRPYYERFIGELMIGRQNMHNGGIGLVTNECNGKIASNAISSYIIRFNDNLEFIYWTLSNEDFYKRIDTMIGGTGQKEISKKELENLKIKMPCLEEQTKIANFLSNIDNLIEEEQKNLNDLKEMKKGLLQQMFV